MPPPFFLLSHVTPNRKRSAKPATVEPTVTEHITETFTRSPYISARQEKLNMTKDPPQRQPGYFMHTDVPADKSPATTLLNNSARPLLEQQVVTAPKRHGIRQETAPEIMHRMYGRRKTDTQRMPGESNDDYRRRLITTGAVWPDSAFDDPEQPKRDTAKIEEATKVWPSITSDEYVADMVREENDVKADEAFYAAQGDDVGDKERPYAHDAYMARRAAEVKPGATPRPALMTRETKLARAKRLRQDGHSLTAEEYVPLLNEHRDLIKNGAHYRNPQGEVIKVENLAVNPEDNYSVHVIVRLVESPVDPKFIHSGPALLLIPVEGNFISGKKWTGLWREVYRSEVWADVPTEEQDVSRPADPHADGVDPEHAYDDLIGKSLVGAADYAYVNWKMAVRATQSADGADFVITADCRSDRINVEVDKLGINAKVTRILGRG